MNENIQKYAEYCLNCKVKPCSNKGCPLNNDIPTFIRLVKENKIEEAYFTLLNTTILGSICGRICPHYKQCMGSCVRGIKGESVQIGAIEAYISDYGLENNLIKKLQKEDTLKGKKIAVIGGGPAGLTASYFLAKEGSTVTIYEKYEKLGGILAHGIPDFRLDPKILEKTIDSILSLGIEVKYNIEIGKDIKVEELSTKYDAVILAVGANVSCMMNIQGESLDGVYGGNELLENKNYPLFKEKIVSVIGGGNVAMDTARTIRKLGAKKVYVIYRRAKDQMPAEEKEIEAAKQEGIEFLFQNNIVKIIGNKKVEEIECIKTKLVQKEGETRLSPVNIEGSNYKLKCDFVIMCIGAKTDENAVKEFERNKWGFVNIDDNMKTSLNNIYAIGDVIGNRATVAWAAKSGRDVAYKIIQNFKNK